VQIARVDRQTGDHQDRLAFKNGAHEDANIAKGHEERIE
jgi:hypothetical protein